MGTMIAKREKTQQPMGPVSLLHLSDTHGLHRTINTDTSLAAGDILIHTGDWTNRGRADVHADFNDWLGEIKHKFKYIVVVAGNHEWSDPSLATTITSPKAYLSSQLSNATHVLEHEGVELCGVRIYGSPWLPGARHGWPEIQVSKDTAATDARGSTSTVRHRFSEIPPGCDVLLTHGPPRGVFDVCESKCSWGSSVALRDAITTAAPAVHCFGHLHEQRGTWRRNASGHWEGGVEYESAPGERYPTWPPPPPAYPGQLISCNAMKNNRSIDGQPGQLVGCGRLIVAVPLFDEKTKMVCVRPASNVWTPGIEWKFLTGEEAKAALR